MASETIRKILKETGAFAEEDIEESAQFVEDYVKAMMAKFDLDIKKSNPKLPKSLQPGANEERQAKDADRQR